MKVVTQNVLYHINEYFVSTPVQTSSAVYGVEGIDYVNQ